MKRTIKANVYVVVDGTSKMTLKSQQIEIDSSDSKKGTIKKDGRRVVKIGNSWAYYPER